MNITTFTKPGSIYLQFPQDQITIYRRTEEEIAFTEIATTLTGYYEDNNVDFGTAYQYKLVSPTEIATTPLCWSLLRGGIYGAVLDIYKGNNNPILMGRIFNNLHPFKLLEPRDVSNVCISTYRYLENDIVNPPQKMEIASKIADIHEVLTSNQVLTSIWTMDDKGYNFIYELPESYDYPVLIEVGIQMYSGKGIGFKLRYLIN